MFPLNLVKQFSLDELGLPLFLVHMIWIEFILPISSPMVIVLASYHISYASDIPKGHVIRTAGV